MFWVQKEEILHFRKNRNFGNRRFSCVVFASGWTFHSSTGSYLIQNRPLSRFDIRNIRNPISKSASERFLDVDWLFSCLKTRSESRFLLNLSDLASLNRSDLALLITLLYVRLFSFLCSIENWWIKINILRNAKKIFEIDFKRL